MNANALISFRKMYSIFYAVPWAQFGGGQGGRVPLLF